MHQKLTEHGKYWCMQNKQPLTKSLEWWRGKLYCNAYVFYTSHIGVFFFFKEWVLRIFYLQIWQVEINLGFCRDPRQRPSFADIMQELKPLTRPAMTQPGVSPQSRQASPHDIGDWLDRLGSGLEKPRSSCLIWFGFRMVFGQQSMTKN